MSLLALYEGLEKNASRQGHNKNDAWAEAAAQYGMTTDEFMDKLAEQQVRKEVEIVKQAREAVWLGKCMGAGYVDTMYKLAAADPIRDEIPEIHIKIARASLIGLCEHMVKAANSPAKAQAILDALKGFGQKASTKADDLLLGLQARTGLGQRGKLIDEARQVLGGKGKLGLGSDAADILGLSKSYGKLRGLQNDLRASSPSFAGSSKKSGWLTGDSDASAITELANKAKVQDQLRNLLSNMGSKLNFT